MSNPQPQPTPDTPRVPFVDLLPQHQPLEPDVATAVQAVLMQGDFILGKAVQRFEQDFAHYCGVDFGVGLACGTDALALGLQACGLGVGDEVLVPVNTFIATLLGIRRTGAKPVLVDCDRATGLIDLEQAADRVTSRTRAILPVHLYGQMVSPQAVQDFANTYGVTIVEDAAQAHGAYRDGQRAGSLGQVAAFSFYPSKNLGAMGDGGMAVTKSQQVAQELRVLRNYGAPQKYWHTQVGTNSRLDTIQAAILEVKLAHLDHWNRQRWEAAQQYDRLLCDRQNSLGLRPLENHSGEGHVYHLYVVELENDRLDRSTLQDHLQKKGIQTGIHYPFPCHLQPAFQDLGYTTGAFPNAEAMSSRILSLPLYPGITSTQVEWVVEALEDIYR